MVSIGLIGLGHVSQRCHLPALELNRNVRLIGFTDPNDEVARVYGKKYQYFESPQKMISQRPDGVIIAAPSNVHAELCVEALSNDINVLVEKPLCISVEKALLIKEALDKSAAKLFVGLNFRHAVQILRLKELLISKALGLPISFQSTFINNISRRNTVTGYEKKRDKGGGVIFDLAYHHFDLLSFIFDSSVTSIQSSIYSRHNDDDIAFIDLKLSNGLHAHGFYSSVGYNDHTLQTFCENGTILVDFFRSTDLYVSGNKNTVFQKFISEGKYSLSMATMAKNVFARYRLDSYARQIQCFVDELTGMYTSLATFDDGFRSLQVAEGAYSSEKTKSWVDIN
jgi:predicted dehydrogenase